MKSNQPAMSGLSGFEPPQASGNGAIRFGSFVLFPQRYLLLRHGEPVALGSRALELLIALTSRPGQLLEKAELMARAWPRVIVEECNLRAQIVALRRILRETDQCDCIVTVPGRGYRFVAPVYPNEEKPATTVHPLHGRVLPRLVTEAIGRDTVVQRLCGQLEQGGFVTLAGPGGIGKTTVALAVCGQLAGRLPHGLCFVDLSQTLSRAALHMALSDALGLEHSSDEPLLPVLEYLREHSPTLVLDNCEQALDATAELVETLLRQAPGCAILATSREPLRAEGEQVERLEPLALPPATVRLNADNALAHPAIRLFIERVKNHDAGFVFRDEDVTSVVGICRRLEGIPLDIELAAARVTAFGLGALEELLEGDFRLQMEGRRTAPPRQRSLRASIDWSYHRLGADEQSMLRLVSVFSGAFTLKAVRAITQGDPRFAGVDPSPLVETLVDKSLLIAHKNGTGRHYRMPATGRIYALRKLEEEGGAQRIVARHAAYALAVVKEAARQLDAVAPDAWKSLYGAESDTVRSALAWAWSPHGNQSLGLDLTLAALGLRPHHDGVPNARQRTWGASPRTLRALQ